MSALRKWLCGFGLLLALTVTAVQAETYHGLHQTYNLMVDSSLVTLMFNMNVPVLEQNDILDSFGRITGDRGGSKPPRSVHCLFAEHGGRLRCLR